MLLGDLIARFSEETVAEEAVLAIGDLAILASLRKEADEKGLGLGACMAEAARRYADEASDEEMITLMGLMSRAQDPGAIYLRRALAHTLQRDAALSSRDQHRGDQEIDRH
jgi:hypothetical protein